MKPDFLKLAYLSLIKYQQSHILFLDSLIFLKEMEEIAKDSNLKFYNSYKKNIEHYKITPRDYFKGNLFLFQISKVELFLQDIVFGILKCYPKKIGKTSFFLHDILDAESNDELISKAVNEYINKIMYMKPLEYLEEITSLLSIDKNMIKDLWPNYIEVKARRDLGIHNNWICNDIYLRKISEQILLQILNWELILFHQKMIIYLIHVN